MARKRMVIIIIMIMVKKWKWVLENENNGWYRHSYFYMFVECSGSMFTWEGCQSSCCMKSFQNKLIIQQAQHQEKPHLSSGGILD